MAFTSAKIPPQGLPRHITLPAHDLEEKNMTGLLLLATAVGEIPHLAGCLFKAFGGGGPT